jgi:hypothetical protein
MPGPLRSGRELDCGRQREEGVNRRELGQKSQDTVETSWSVVTVSLKVTPIESARVLELEPEAGINSPLAFCLQRAAETPEARLPACSQAIGRRTRQI